MSAVRPMPAPTGIDPISAQAEQWLDRADTDMREGPEGIAKACSHVSRAGGLLAILDARHVPVGGLGRRIHDAQMLLLDAMQSIDADDLRGRVLGALRRLGGERTVGDVHREVLARIALKEETRVQFLHMLGRDVVMSWPDHHGRHEVAACLAALRRERLTRYRIPAAFWGGPLWALTR